MKFISLAEVLVPSKQYAFFQWTNKCGVILMVQAPLRLNLKDGEPQVNVTSC